MLMAIIAGEVERKVFGWLAERNPIEGEQPVDVRYRQAMALALQLYLVGRSQFA